jgi:hypothetical protein
MIAIITNSFSAAWALAAPGPSWFANYGSGSQIDDPDGSRSPGEALTFQEQSPRCDHNIYPGAESVYGDRLLDGKPLNPGDTVCVHAGTYSGDLAFYNFAGTAERPITITNVGGQVVVKRGVLRLISSQYVTLQGSGVEGVTYGIKVLDPYTSGLAIRQGKGFPGSKGYGIRNIEVHHIEILYDRTHGLHAVGGGNDDGSEPVENLSLHDFYLHRTKRHPSETSGNYREGFYIGSSYYNSHDVATLRGVEIYNNLVEEPGWDGIQVGSASGGCRIHDNTVIRDSRERLYSEHSGIIVNNGSKCDVYNNTIMDSYGAGIYYGGIGGHIYNNLVVLAGTIEHEPRTAYTIQEGRPQMADSFETRRGIALQSTVDVKDGGRRGDLFVYHNTIVDAKRYAIDVSEDYIGNYKIFDNLIVNSQNGISPVRSPSRVFNNYVGRDSDANFADFASRDYHLTERSGVAIEQGVWDSHNRATTDLDGRARVGLPDIGAYEYTGGPPIPTSTPPPPPSSPPSETATPTATLPPATSTSVPTQTPTPASTPTTTPMPTPTPAPNLPPICTDASARVKFSWEEKKLVVKVRVIDVTDPDGDPVKITIDGIFHDGLAETTSDAGFFADVRGVGKSVAELRADLAGIDIDWAFRITFTASDPYGGSCDGEVRVEVRFDLDEAGAPASSVSPVADSARLASPTPAP